MAIQNRRGAYVDFKPNKMVSGEWAIVLSGDPNAVSGQSVYIAFNNSQVKRMATYEDMVENINIATADIQAELRSGVEEAIGDIKTAISDAQAAVTTMEGQITLAIADADDRISAIEAEYEDLVIADEARLGDMQYQIDVAVATAANATSAANEAAADALEAAEEAREIIEQGSVASVFGRAGIVVAQAGDYDSTQITHDVGVSVADAISSLETLTDGKVDKSGDTMTGDLTIVRGKGLLSSDKTNFTYPLIRDNGTNLWIGATQNNATHHAGATFISTGYDTTNNIGYESINVSVPNAANNGATSYKVYHQGYKPSASDVNAVAKSGDTMTGTLTIQGSQLNINYKSTDIDSDIGKTVPASGAKSFGGMYVNDKNGTNNGWVRIYKSSTDNLYWDTTIRRKSSGGEIVSNTLQIGINPSGGRYVAFSDSKIWRDALGLRANITDNSAGSITIPSGSAAFDSTSNIQKRSGIAVANFVFKLPAGTHLLLLKLDPLPKETTRCLVAVGSNITSLRISTNGEVRFNNSMTITNTMYVIGQVTYAY